MHQRRILAGDRTRPDERAWWWDRAGVVRRFWKILSRRKRHGRISVPLILFPLAASVILVILVIIPDRRVYRCVCRRFACRACRPSAGARVGLTGLGH